MHLFNKYLRSAYLCWSCGVSDTKNPSCALKEEAESKQSGTSSRDKGARILQEHMRDTIKIIFGALGRVLQRKMLELRPEG